MQDRKPPENTVVFGGSYEATSRLKIDCGFRFSGFAALVQGSFYTVNADEQITDKTRHDYHDATAFHFMPEPRISVGYQLTKNNALKLAYTRNAEYLPLISSSITSSPTDKWIPGNVAIKLITSNQMSAGYVQELSGGRCEFGTEVVRNGCSTPSIIQTCGATMP